MKTLFCAAAIVAASIVGANAATVLTEGASEAADAQVFQERTVTVGAGDVTADYVVGSNLNVGDDFTGVSQFSSGLDLDAGSYSSYLIHFDPIGNNGGTTSGSYTFGGDIVAIIVSNGAGVRNRADGVTPQLLADSDSVFGSASDYVDTLSRRSENPDLFELVSADTLAFSFATSARYVDNVRVITEVAPVPVPASLPLLLAGLGGLAYLRRRAS